MMVIYRYLDDDKVDDATDRTVSAIELLHQHEIRYVMHIDKGDIILRHQPLRMKRIIDGIIKLIYPRFSEYAQELHDLTDGISENEMMVPEVSDKIKDLTSKLRIITQMYALGVIESPHLNDMDDLNDLYATLNENERNTLDMLIQELTNVTASSLIDDTALVIADKYNIQLVSKEMLEQLTVSQADFLIRRINAENEQISELMKEKAVK